MSYYESENFHIKSKWFCRKKNKPILCFIFVYFSFSFTLFQIDYHRILNFRVFFFKWKPPYLNLNLKQILTRILFFFWKFVIRILHQTIVEILMINLIVYWMFFIVISQNFFFYIWHSFTNISRWNIYIHFCLFHHSSTNQLINLFWL